MTIQPSSPDFALPDADLDNYEPQNFGGLLRAALQTFSRLKTKAVISGLCWFAIPCTLFLLCFVNSHGAPVFVGAALLFGLVAVAGGLLWTVALQQMAASDRFGQSLSLAEMFTSAKTRFWRVVGISLLVGLMPLIPFLLLRIMRLPLFGVQLLLNIGVLVVGCRFFLARPVAIFEDRGIIDSLRRSWELTSAGGLGGWIKRYIAYTGTSVLVFMILMLIFVAILIAGASQSTPTLLSISLLQGGFGRILVCYILAMIVLTPILAISEFARFEMYADQLLRNGEEAPGSELGAPTYGDETSASLA